MAVILFIIVLFIVCIVGGWLLGKLLYWYFSLFFKDKDDFYK